MLRKRLFWIAVAAVLLVASGGGYYFYNSGRLQAQEAGTEQAITTYTVAQGDLVISVSGSGTLIPTSEIDLGFSSSGVLSQLLVKVGSQVEPGQVLARLDDTDAQDQVAEAEIALRQAELDLADLSQPADAAELAAAQASLSSAKASLTALTSPAETQEVLSARETLKSAKAALDDLLALPDADEVEIAKADMTLAEMTLRNAQSAYDRIAWQENVGSSQEALDLWQATTDYERAKAEYAEACEGATAEELADARAQIALAQAQLDALLAANDPDSIAAAEANVAQAQATLDELLAGASAKELETAELAVEQARLSLESAKRALTATELAAPSAGVVTAVAAQVGESVSAGTLITLADMSEPQVQFWVEEADLSRVVPGNQVNIEFDALPDVPFSGMVLSVDPALVTVSSTPAVQAYASIDLSPAQAQSVTLVSGMNADIEVVAGEARNAVLVPLTALREVATGQYAVSVVNANGELQMRLVEVGLKDFVNAEILSGLQVGDVVKLGAAMSAGTSSETATGEQGLPGMDGEMPLMGGGMPPMGGGGMP